MKSLRNSCLVLVMACAVCSAGAITGDLSISAIAVTEDGTNLSNSTVIGIGGSISTSADGDYAAIINGTQFGNTSLYLKFFEAFSLVDNHGDGFFAGGGSIIVQTPTELQADLIGVFVPGTTYTQGFDTTPASVLVTVIQNGTSLSESFVLTSPATSGTPEPSTIMMFAASIVSFSATRALASRSGFKTLKWW